MTKRFLYNKTWAQDGVKADPDLDTTDPSYIANRYANVGWKAEKPPEQWQNFLSNITDEKFANDLIQTGIMTLDGTMVYKNYALLFDGSIKIRVGNNVFSSPVSETSSGYTSSISSLQNKYDNHTKSTNPHNDTVDNIVGGTYLSKDVDSWFGSQTDNRTIVWHKLQTGAVHKETPAQVGTLPSTGGTFTGPVIFSKILYIKDTNFSADLWSSPALDVNPVVRFFNNGNQFYLTDDGRVYSRIYRVNYQWATEINISDWYIKTNFLFTAPTPLFKFNSMFSLNDGDSIGSWWMEANETVPLVFHAKGGVKLDGAELYWCNANSSLPRNTSKIVGRKEDGSLVCRVLRHGYLVSAGGMANKHNLVYLLTNLGCADIKFLISYDVYAGDLTNQQISSIRFI